MQADLSTKQCTNCLKMFPDDKIDLHQAYCCRNIRRCQNCTMMVDINDMQTHNKEFHTKKSCHMCNKQFQPSVINQHLEVCPRKPTLCKYCQNTFAFQQFIKHQGSCGARTQICSICQRPIMIKDLSSHQQRCQRRRSQRPQVSQDQYRQHRRHQGQRNLGQRQRQRSTNNFKEGERSNSNQRLLPPLKVKQKNIIGPQKFKPVIDPVPISIRLAIRARQQKRIPLKNKN